MILQLLLLIITLCGCGSNNNTEIVTITNDVLLQEDKFVALDKKEVTQENIETVTPVPGQSFLDSMYTNSENKASDNNSLNIDNFEHDLSRIEEQAIKELIISLYNENKCTSLLVMDYFFDNIDSQEVRYCVVKLNTRVYIINYSDGKAYAVEDTHGIYEENVGLEQED